MITFPTAKINLGLRITSKRHDGFHNIETIFYPVCLTDALEFITAPGNAGDDEIVLTGINIGSGAKNNLVIRAARKMREHYRIPFLKIHLHKAIPAGAGLGGGSADAAFIIKAINKCFRLSIDDSTLKMLALEIGSDCPFFIDNVPSYATGRGEILKELNHFLKGFRLVLVNQGIKISTREAYLNCIPVKPENNLEELVQGDPAEWCDLVKNDFEDYAFKLHPEIRELKRALYNSGAVYSSMSGSGSSVFGIFKEKPALPPMIRKYLIYEGMI